MGWNGMGCSTGTSVTDTGIYIEAIAKPREFGRSNVSYCISGLPKLISSAYGICVA